MAKAQATKPIDDLTRPVETDLLEKSGYSRPPVAHVKRPPAPPLPPKKKED